jgi:hypothetical protein
MDTNASIRCTSDIYIRFGESGVLLEEANDEGVEVVSDLIFVGNVTLGISHVRETSTKDVLLVPILYGVSRCKALTLRVDQQTEDWRESSNFKKTISARPN